MYYSEYADKNILRQIYNIIKNDPKGESAAEKIERRPLAMKKISTDTDEL